MIDKKKQAILDAIEQLKSGSDSIPMESEPIEETTEEQANELDKVSESDNEGDDEESRFEKLKKRLQFLGK